MPDFHRLPNQTNTTPDRGRSSKRDYLPTSVRGRSIANVIYGSTINTLATTLGNDEQSSITFSITQNREYEILSNLYISVYVDSIATANQLPFGSNVDESDWQVIGPLFDWQSWNNASYPRHEDYVKLYIRNISAGSKDLFIRYRWRYFSPRES